MNEKESKAADPTKHPNHFWDKYISERIISRGKQK